MSPEHLVFDSSPLNYFTRSNQLAVLSKLVSGHICHITKAVEEELLRGAAKHAQLYQATNQPWISAEDENSLSYLSLFSKYHSRLGGGSRNIGEATTLAYAEYHNYQAVVDDRTGRRHGREEGLKVTGTLELLCKGIRDGVMGKAEAATVVDRLCDHEAFLPCDGAGLIEWAQAEGLLV